MPATHSDALVFFGATGDLAYKKIFPALQSMVRRGRLSPVIGVAKAGWGLDQFKARRATASRSTAASTRLPSTSSSPCSATSMATITTRKRFRRCAPLGPAEHPTHYLAIPPALFGLVVEQLGKSGSPAAPASSSRSRSDATWSRRRHSTASCSKLPRIGDLPHRPLPRQGAGAEPALFPLRQLVFGAALEPRARREHPDHDGGEFRRPGPRRLLRGGGGDPRRGAEPPLASPRQPDDGAARRHGQRVGPRREGRRCCRAIPPLRPEDVVRGQFRGYREEKGVAADSTVETFAALRLEIESWRWQGVPVYIRAGKCLPVTCTEAIVRLRRPPALYSARRRRRTTSASASARKWPSRWGRGQDAGRSHDRRRGRAAGDRHHRRTRWTPTSGCWATR